MRAPFLWAAYLGLSAAAATFCFDQSGAHRDHRVLLGHSVLISLGTLFVVAAFGSLIGLCVRGMERSVQFDSLERRLEYLEDKL
jgi:hypothetical protein